MIDELIQQLQGCRISPVYVFDHDEQRVPLSLTYEVLDQRLDRELLLSFEDREMMVDIACLLGRRASWLTAARKPLASSIA